MNYYQNLYNIFAIIISYLDECFNSDLYKRFNSLESDKENQYKMILKSELHEMYDGEGNNRINLQLSMGFHKEDFLLRIEKLFNSKKRDIFFLLFLIKDLDSAIAPIREKTLRSGDDIIGFDALNTNYDVSGIKILPRYDCFWERKSRGATYCKNLCNILNYTYYVKKSDISEYNIKSVVLNSFHWRHIANHKTISIGISPISNKDYLNVKTNYHDDRYWFYIDSLKNNDEIVEKVKKIIESAAEKKTDILLFPEMLGSYQLEEQIKKYFEMKQLEYPLVTVLPSIWADNKNQSIVIDNTGSIICRQHKHEMYSYHEEGHVYWEDINSDKAVYLIHCQGIGRIVIAICIDFLQDEYVDLLIKKLKSTLILSPSYSTGSYDFKKQIQSGNLYDCNCAWVNSCSAINLPNANIDNFDTIAMVTNYGRGRNNSDIYASEKNEISREDECNKCDNICLEIRNIQI